VGVICFLIALFAFQFIATSSFDFNTKKSDRTQKTSIPISNGETENSESGSDDDNVQKEISDFEKMHLDRHWLHFFLLIENYTTYRAKILRYIPSDIFLPPPEIQVALLSSNSISPSFLHKP